MRKNSPMLLRFTSIQHTLHRTMSSTITILFDQKFKASVNVVGKCFRMSGVLIRAETPWAAPKPFHYGEPLTREISTRGHMTIEPTYLHPARIEVGEIRVLVCENRVVKIIVHSSERRTYGWTELTFSLISLHPTKE